MTRSFVTWVLPPLGLVAILGLGSPPALPAPGEKKGPGREVEELIRQLGDKRHAVREAATRRLMELPKAAPALRAALQSPDAEVARRAALILEKLGQGEGQRALARLKEHGKNREVDQAVELLVGRPRWEDNNACWQVLTSLAADLIERGRKVYGSAVPPSNNFLPAGDFSRYLKTVRPSFLNGPQIRPPREAILEERFGFVVRGTDLVVDNRPFSRGALIAATGGVRFLYTGELTCRCSVIYAGGPVELSELSQSVLVCDGDLTVRGIGQSLVIVRGDVHCARNGGVGTSLIITSGRFHLGKNAGFGKTKVFEQQADLLGFVTFLDPAREGIEVEGAKGGVRVKAATPGKPFAKAGLAAADLIVAVNGQPAESPEVFRRLLRRTFVTGENTLLRVERDGKQTDVRVPGRQ